MQVRAALEPACHIIYRSFTRKMRVLVETTSATLPESVLGELRQATAHWRDRKYQLRRVQAMRDAGRCPPVAIINHLDGSPPPPLLEPFELPFEPLLLQEEEPRLQDVLAGNPAWSAVSGACPAAAAQLQQLQPGSAGAGASRGKRRPLRSGFARRWMLRSGLIFFAIPLVVNALVHGTIHFNRPGGRLLAAGLLLTTLAIGALVACVSDTWYVTPGGVIMRRSLLRFNLARAALFTPADSLLSVMPMPGGWGAWIQGPRTSAYRQITDIELLVLLAAWQSRLPPPTREQARELLTA